jgi:serine/threonine protein kinase
VSRKGAPPKIPGLVFVQPLGSGGYADVVLYEQQSPRMPVAVKVLKSEGLTDALRQQFVEEADTMAALGDHPYIVQVFRSGTSDDGRPYLVMKYYPPPNLAMRARAERFSVEDVLRTGIQLASAVETAHRAHITHRDIKPANVLISAYGAPGLTDFGIAGQLGHGAAEDDDDDVGVSVPWAPPEVLFGQSSGDVRSDVYSLAATLWQLLVGRSPFEVPGGDNSAYALMPRIRSTAPPATGRPDVPAGLERLLAQAMAKDPSHRPASALEFARALQAVEQQQRLGRTPIVVLDEQGHTTLVSQTQGSPTGRGGDDEDRTRIKAPQTVVAQPLGPSPTMPDGETRRRSDAGGQRWSPAPVPSAGPAPSTAPVRPAAATDPVTSQTAPLGSDSSEEATVRRAAGAAGAQEAPAPAQPPVSPLSKPPVLWGLAAGVVVLVGLVVFLLLRGGGGGAPEPALPSPSATVSMPGDDSAIGDGVFDKPTVTARSGAGSVGFTWNYPQPDKKDTFRLSYAPTASDAGNPERSKLVSVTTRSYTVKAAKGTKVCATVRVSRSGQVSPGSDVQCETAQ